jgi:hypothetical protein
VLLAAGIAVAAIPDALVFTVTVFEPPNVALAPPAGAVNITGTPAIGFENESVTFA